MSNFAIGDIQGCYDSFINLLAEIHFKPTQDTLWLVGDLVNRGPASLAVLRYLYDLPLQPIITLGNHDLHLLAVYKNVRPLGHHDTFHDILEAHDGAELCSWLQSQRLLHFDPQFNVLMVHAGVAPMWSLAEACEYATEVETMLHGNDVALLLQNMYGNTPPQWTDDLVGSERWRVIINYLTRIRFCDESGALELNYKGTIDSAPANLIPWFDLPGKIWQQHKIIFGHWAALQGKSHHPQLFPLDTGCVWGGPLTAMRLEDGKHYSVAGWQGKM